MPRAFLQLSFSGSGRPRMMPRTSRAQRPTAAATTAGITCSATLSPLAPATSSPILPC